MEILSAKKNLVQCHCSEVPVVGQDWKGEWEWCSEEALSVLPLFFPLWWELWWDVQLCLWYHHGQVCVRAAGTSIQKVNLPAVIKFTPLWKCWLSYLSLRNPDVEACFKEFHLLLSLSRVATELENSSSLILTTPPVPSVYFLGRTESVSLSHRSM